MQAGRAITKAANPAAAHCACAAGQAAQQTIDACIQCILTYPCRVYNSTVNTSMPVWERLCTDAAVRQSLPNKQQHRQMQWDGEERQIATSTPDSSSRRCHSGCGEIIFPTAVQTPNCLFVRTQLLPILD